MTNDDFKARFDALVENEEWSEPDEWKFDDPECPEGDECPVHHRVDSRVYFPEDKDARFVTYVGDYAVITDIDVTVGDILAAFGMRPMAYISLVQYVGDGHISSTMEDEDAIGFKVKFHNFDQFELTHDLLVEGVRAGVIGKPE